MSWSTVKKHSLLNELWHSKDHSLLNELLHSKEHSLLNELWHTKEHSLLSELWHSKEHSLLNDRKYRALFFKLFTSIDDISIWVKISREERKTTNKWRNKERNEDSLPNKAFRFGI